QLKSKSERVVELEAANEELKGRLQETLASLERETVERQAAQEKAEEGVKAAEERAAAVRTVDDQRRQAKRQEDAYDVLEGEMEKLRAKLRDAERDAADAADETEAKSREVASVNRRASSLQSQCSDLEKELDERTKALATYRGQKTQELMQAMSQVAEVTQRADDEKAKTDEAVRVSDGFRGRLTRTEGDLKAMSEQVAVDKTALEKQISLQETLTNLEREKANEATKKIESLQREIRGLEGQVARERDRVVQERQRADTVRDKSKAVVDGLKAKLLEKEAEVRKAGDSAQAAARRE
ncbi:unnamed protein product, partial [Laminaria digitata]